MISTPKDRIASSSVLALALKQQANVRIGICIFMGAYFSRTEYLIHPLYFSFIAYSIAIFGITRKLDFLRIGPAFTFLTLSFDVIFTIVSLHLVGAYGYFLFLILIQISFGYGVRFGTLMLWTSTLFACFGILTLFLISDYWRARPFEVTSFLVGVPFLAIYIHFLNDELKAAKLQSDIQASTYSKLLKYVSHDIRTQLQSLLGASEEMLGDKPNSNAVQHFFRMQEIIHSLARLATNFVQEIPGKVTYGDRTESSVTSEVYLLGEWMGKICLRFSPQMRANSIRFTVGFAEHVPIFSRLDYSSLERLLVNSLSNAVRHSKDGLIEIEITCESPRYHQGFIVIRIRNICPSGFEKSSRSDVDVLSQRLFFGSGLGHAISNSIAFEAGGSFIARAVGPKAFLCEIKMPCAFYSALNPKPMAYPAVYISRSIENYQRTKKLLSSTCGLYRSPLALYPAIRMLQESDNVSTFLFDCATDDAQPDENIEVDNVKAEGVRCDVYLKNCKKNTNLTKLSNCAALATLSPCSLNSAIAFAAAYNQKDAKVEKNFSPIRLEGAKLSGIYIEDSNFSGNVILAAAQREGWTLDCANLMSQALEMLRCNEYDFILMDWELGRSTAVEVLDVYRQLQSRPDRVRIIILSAHARARIFEWLEDRKVHLVLEKPIATDVLIEQIAACFREFQRDQISFREELNWAPEELFDCSSYEALSGEDAQRATVIYLLETLVVEIDAALEELSQFQDSTTSEVRRIVHRLIGVAEAGGARTLAMCARAIITESNDRPKVEMNLLNAIWLVTARHVRTFRATLFV